MTKPIRIMLVDDHDVVRFGLKSFLDTQEGLDVVAEAANGIEAIKRALEVKPDVILMDITMPEMDGMEATRQLKTQCPDCLVLALTVHEDKEYFIQMLGAGASGYITKQAASDELVMAIETVAKGHVYLQPALARWLLEDYQRLSNQYPVARTASAAQGTGSPVGLDVLSQRELQVLELVADGHNNKYIGEALGLSPKTIARHRERIMNKLNMHSRTELVKFAIRTGLIQLD
ncbi:MAG: response regulator transcription factor [Anaerolineae bacterium]|jgi:two-component system, NarL family, response regulator NreC|nr:response regulator transcription factor [Anaerolineae bacterium]MBT7191364.1 response regulator transcription factor [Anaerolineae bacterium]MBT7991239.1 response regulator transcription factor [Anaerolineae bacterium]